MVKKMVMYIAGNKIIAQFQVRYMYFTDLKQNKALKTKWKIIILLFSGTAVQATKSVEGR